MQPKKHLQVFALAWTKIFAVLTLVVRTMVPEQRLLLLFSGVLTIVFGFFFAYYNLQ